MTDATANAHAPRDQLFQRALSLHERGDIQGALQAYEAILAGNPADFDALHLLGVIAVQAGRPQVGVDLISRAIGVSDAVAAAFSNRGCALNEMGRHAEALSAPAALARKIGAYARSGDFVVCLGAGSISQWAQALPGELEQLKTPNGLSGALA